MPCPNKKTVRSYLTPDEYETISTMADAADISVSAFIRKVWLGQEIKFNLHTESATDKILQSYQQLEKKS